MPTQRPRAVFFDLDDTLFDYRHAARAGLRAAARLDAALAQASFADLEATHLEYVEQLHPRVLRGELTYEQARAERFRRLLVLYGGDPAAAPRAAECFAGHLRSEERLVPGAAELLARLAAAGVRLGIISNNTRAEQIGKLTVNDVNAALKKYLDPSRTFIVRAGDFAGAKKKAAEEEAKKKEAAKKG